jgi:hypothetical protein
MKLNKDRRYTAFALMALLAATPLFAQRSLSLTVSNRLPYDRCEVVAVRTKEITKFLKGKKEVNLGIKNKETGEWQTLQWIDYDGDKISDEMLFMANVKANSTAQYVVQFTEGATIPQSNIMAYSRFVSERTDDYTWENDKVAFRTYGPDAQQRTEQKRENGTLSSGIDIWLKRTPESVINKWYAGYKTDPLYYHKDRGEGYDPYHVGASRGTGGTGVWINDSLQVSKNFTGYKTISEGPLRTVFELYYAPYSENVVTETKRISLDLGSNFSKFEVTYSSQKPLPNYAVGITLHDNQGKTTIVDKRGLFAHHEAIDGTYVGEGLIVQPGIVQKAFAHKSKTKDQSNLVVLTKPSGKITYYAGFAWGKGGQATNEPEWEALLKKQLEIIGSPLTVTFK